MSGGRARLPRRATGRHSPFYDLLDALRQPGCGLCTLAARTRWRFLDSLAYENVNDIATRQKLRDALGFCNRHAWFFVENVREVFGAGIIYRDLLHAVQRRAATGRADPFQPGGPCIACLAENDALADTIDTLTESLDAPDLRQALQASDGLCVPHLRRALATAPPRSREILARLVSDAWESAADDLAILQTRAVGATDSLGVDEQVFDEAISETAPLPPGPGGSETSPFHCVVCQTVHADLAGFPKWTALDDGAGSLCNVHAWQEAGSDADDLYRRQVQATRDGLEGQIAADGKSFLAQAMHTLGFSRAAAAPWGSLWLPLRCVVCRHQASLETVFCADARGTLCVPHLRRAVALGNPDAIADQPDTWHELDRLLGEYLRKEDYRFRAEPRGIEQSSPRWAVALIAGEPGIR